MQLSSAPNTSPPRRRPLRWDRGLRWLSWSCLIKAWWPTRDLETSRCTIKKNHPMFRCAGVDEKNRSRLLSLRVTTVLSYLRSPRRSAERERVGDRTVVIIGIVDGVIMSLLPSSVSESRAGCQAKQPTNRWTFVSR